MVRNLIKANAKEIAGREKPDSGDFSVSPNIDNSGRGVLKVRNNSWEINDKYAQPGDLNFQRSENGGLTNVEVQRSIYSANHAIYNPSPFIAPLSWSSSVNVAMPAGYSAGKTITGNDGKQYVEMRDSQTGELVSHLGQYSCMSANADVFNPLKATTKSLRDNDQHAEINYKIGADGQLLRRSESEIAFREMMVDLDNSATKLPNQLNMIRIITNDTLAANNPKFQSAAQSDIKTPVAPSEIFSNPVPVQPIMLKPNAPVAPWQIAQNDPKF